MSSHHRAGNPFTSDPPDTQRASSFEASKDPFAGEKAPVSPFNAAARIATASPYAAVFAVPADAPSGSYGYALRKNGPEVRSEEVELADTESVEIMVLWGNNVLHVAHLTPPRPFFVGEDPHPIAKHNTRKPQATCDYFIPSEKLGHTRIPIVSGDASELRLVLPPGANGTVDLPGQQRMSLDQARALAEPSAELAGAQQLPFSKGGKARIELGGFTFVVSSVKAGKPMPHGLGAGVDSTAAAYFGVSFLAHAGIMAALAMFVPPLGLSDDADIDKEQIHLIQQYLQSSAEREQEAREATHQTEDVPTETEGGTGTQSKGEQGAMGNPTKQKANNTYGVKGPEDNPDPHVARQVALREAREFGMIGMLNSMAGGDPDAPTAPWGRDHSLGVDERSARGNMWGDQIGEAFGSGGLGLTGIGEGGGGRGEGIGLGDIGTIGHGAGTGSDQGFGPDIGRQGPGHQTTAPGIRTEKPITSGLIPPQVIQRIVRQNYGRFRMCYEQGLSRNPNLEGRIATRFIIGRDGAVSNVQNGGSDLPDDSVVSCVISRFYGLSFPAPEGGIVTVVYPIMFAPG